MHIAARICNVHFVIDISSYQFDVFTHLVTYTEADTSSFNTGTNLPSTIYFYEIPSLLIIVSG